MQEKIAQYVGVKNGEDISNELTNMTTVIVPPPVYSIAIQLKHQEWEAHIRKKQTKVKAALEAKLNKLQALDTIDEDEQYEVKIADRENQIEDIEYQQGQEVPFNLTDTEKLKYSSESKAHSVRVATLEKHRGNVYDLIFGQCTQILQDKMKQDKNWAAVSISYKPLELYKSIERVILKQLEDQYPVAALWEQLSTNAKQGNLTSNEWYDRFNTKVEVAESVGVGFEFEKIWENCAQDLHKAPYAT